MTRIREAHPVIGRARRVMDALGLEGWSIVIGRAKTEYGECNLTKKRITISGHFLAHGSEDEIVETLLHEIAHALAGPGEHHGPKWRRLARSLGATGDRCGTGHGLPDPQWEVWCPSCDRLLGRRHRRLRGAVHKACLAPIEYRKGDQ